MRRYVVDQLRDKIIPQLEAVAGKKLDYDRLREQLALSARAEDDLVAVWESARHRPSPIDAYFGGVYYVGPIFSSFRGTEDAVAYYRELREEIDERVARGEGPMTPDGAAGPERYRLVVEGPPNGRASSTSGGCSAGRAPPWSRARTPGWAGSTTAASATTPTTPSRASPRKVMEFSTYMTDRYLFRLSNSALSAAYYMRGDVSPCREIGLMTIDYGIKNNEPRCQSAGYRTLALSYFRQPVILQPPSNTLKWR